LTFTFDACEVAESVGLLPNYPGEGNWWVRAPLAAENVNGNSWQVTIGDADVPFAGEAGMHYKWVVNGAPSPVLEHEWTGSCHHEYDERIVDNSFTPPTDVAGCLESGSCPSDKPTTLTFSFDACKDVDAVGLLPNYPGEGNWWERAPLAAVNVDGTMWQVTLGDTDVPFAGEAGMHYKWIVDGAVSPVIEHEWTGACHHEYDERIVDATFTPPADVVGCLEGGEYPSTCSAEEPTTFTFTFDACAPACDADGAPGGCVKAVGFQVLMDGFTNADGEQLAFHWYERPAYPATNVEGTTTWTLTFPFTQGDQTLPVPPVGTTYKVYVDGIVPAIDDDVAEAGCFQEYDERKMNVWTERVDRRNCIAECPEFVEVVVFDAAKRINFPTCSFVGRSYMAEGSTQIPSAVADGNACQAACTKVNTFQPGSCAIWSYNYELAICHISPPRELPPTSEWFESADEVVSGPVDCGDVDVCFYNNAVYGNADFGASGFAGLPGVSPVYVPTEARKAALEGEGWWDGAKTVTVEDMPTPEACHAKCAATDGCDWFDWTGLEGSDPKECWLKTELGDTTNHIGIKMGVVVGPKVCPDTTVAPVTEATVAPVTEASVTDAPVDTSEEADVSESSEADVSGSGSGSTTKKEEEEEDAGSAAAAMAVGATTTFAMAVAMLM
jgi:hypothetical protein